MKYNRQGFCDASDETKMKIVEEELRLVTHNGITKDDLLMLLEWTYYRAIKKDYRDDDDWIPVEDGLPEDERMVLVTYMTKSGISSVDRARFDGKYWRGSGFMGRVIAWRPLPEPYKSKKDISAAGEHIMSRFMKVE